MFIVFVIGLIFVDVMILLGTVYGLVSRILARNSNKKGLSAILLVGVIIYFFRFINACGSLTSYESTGNPMIILWIPPIALAFAFIVSKIKSQ